ncbi:MAG: DUF5666 domain-containing protein [Pseudomonadota bacterium]
MTKIDRRGVLAGLSATALTGCAEPLMVGDAKEDPKGGIGGTGIVGVLVEFGSLIVNGLRVRLDAETVVSDPFGPLSQSDLAVGQSLTIEAATVAGDLVARRVEVTYPVVGIVTLSPLGAPMVNGVEVELEPGAIGLLEPGARVAVSGLWRGTRVVASRIDPLPANGLSAISGDVATIPSSTRRAIAKRPILVEPGRLPPPRSFVTIIGNETPRGLIPARIVPGRFFGAAGPLRNLSVEGYLEPIEGAPFFAVSGLGHSFDRDAKLSEFRTTRAIFSGGYSGDFQVETGAPLPDDVDARREVVREVLAGTRPPGRPTR